jgi:S1-C subfamily serine protease
MLPRIVLSSVVASLCLVAFPAAAQAKGYLGVQIRMDPDGKGILIMEIHPGSPAAKAGLKSEDIIRKIDGTEPTSLAEFVEIVGLKQPGLEVTLDVLRDGKEKKVKVTVGKMSAREE